MMIDNYSRVGWAITIAGSTSSTVYALIVAEGQIPFGNITSFLVEVLQRVLEDGYPR